MNVSIKGKEVTLKYGFRALMVYEQIMGKTFEPKGVTEVLTFMYCVIISSEKNLEFSYDEFLDMIDEQPELIKEFSEWLTETVQRNNFFAAQNVSAADKKKAQKVKKSKN